LGQSNSKGLPRPEEFPVGSAESRAAARAMLESRESSVRRVQIIMDIPRPRREGLPETRVGLWSEQPDGTLLRFLFVPPGTDEVMLKQLLATP
jgi:hypothetical protein